MMTLPIISTRYELLSRIGSGGMGVVYSAHDRLLRRSVALKRVATSPQQADLYVTRHYRLQLAEEFRVMAALRHPHIVQVLDYGFDLLGYPYFTMELLQNSRTLLEAAADGMLLHKTSLLWQVMQALQYLHRQGILHRDLKPNNILVVNGQVKVLDFGLATTIGNYTDASGTLAYMPPEVIQQQAVTERSDIYSLAVMAYEMFSEKTIYKGLTVPQMMAQVLGVMPDMTLMKVSPALTTVLQRALMKRPDERYDTMTQFMMAFNASLDIPLPIETAEQRESLLMTPRFVGRREELQLLQTAWLDTQHKHGSGWLIAGENGVGKSRLVAEIRTQAFIEGGVVVQGQAVREGARPFQIWEEALRWWCFLLPLSDEEMTLLLPVIPDLADPAADTRTLDAVDETRADPERLYETIISLAARVTTPMLIILEDLQWADGESQQLLQRMSAALAAMPILLLATYRDDQSPFPSQSLRHLRLIRLHRFNRNDISELALAMVGSTDSRLVDFLQQHTEGNIYFLQEVLRALSEQGGDTFNITSDELPATLLTQGIETIAQRRLNLLPAEHLPLLRYAAVTGRVINLPLLHALMPIADLDLWLSDCAFTVLDRVDGQWRFMHDKIRESLLEHMSAVEKHELHDHVTEVTTQLDGLTESGVHQQVELRPETTPERDERSVSVHILTIDDDMDNLQLIRKILEGAGYLFTGALTGREGLRLALADTYQLIILDIGLPDVQGDEVARQLKQHSRTPILALTGNDEQGDREVYLDAGCDGYLAKPISRPYLLNAIQELLAR